MMISSNPRGGCAFNHLASWLSLLDFYIGKTIVYFRGMNPGEAVLNSL